MGKAESFKAHELFWLSFFVFSSSIYCLMGSVTLPFLSLLNLPAPLALSQTTVREKRSCCVIVREVWNFAFINLSLDLHFWVSPTQFCGVYPDCTNPETLCGCNSSQLSIFCGVNGELQCIHLRDQSLEPVRHWAGSWEAKALGYCWSGLFLRSFNFPSNVRNFNLKQYFFFFCIHLYCLFWI